MEKIQLTRNCVAIVDIGDYGALARHKWCATQPAGGRIYATRRGAGREMLYMHRVIMDAPPGQDVDHINGNTLDNRRANLRICSRSENLRNSKTSDRNTSGYKGVYRLARDGVFVAQITHNRRAIYLGRFVDPATAAQAYDRKAIELFGDFARLNFTRGDYE